WSEARVNDVLTNFTARLARLRAEHPVFRRRRFFQGRTVPGSDVPDIAWLRPDGQPMTEADWTTGTRKAVMVFLNGLGLVESDPLGERIVDDSFLLLFNANPQI